MRQTDFAGGLDDVADLGVWYVLPFLRAAVNVEPACRRLRRFAAQMHRFRLDMVADFRLPRRVLRDARLLDETAGDVEILAGKGKNVICRQRVRRHKAQGAEDEEKQQERKEGPAAPAEDEGGGCDEQKHERAAEHGGGQLPRQFRRAEDAERKREEQQHEKALLLLPFFDG